MRAIKHYLAGFIQGLRTCKELYFMKYPEGASPFNKAQKHSYCHNSRHEGFYTRGHGKAWDSYKRGFAKATGYEGD